MPEKPKRPWWKLHAVTWALQALIWLGVLALPFGAMVGADTPFEDGLRPMPDVLHRRAIGTAVIAGGASVAVMAAVALYILNRQATDE